MWILQKRSKIEKDSGRPEDEDSRRDERWKLDFRFLSLVMGRCIRYIPRFHGLFDLKKQKLVRNQLEIKTAPAGRCRLTGAVFAFLLSFLIQLPKGFTKLECKQNGCESYSQSICNRL